MPRNPKPATADDDREPRDEITTEGLVDAAYTIATEMPNRMQETDGALLRLTISDIITVINNHVVWRPGHLEHIANQYKGDPETTERNYADDLAVARVYSAELWEKLIRG